MNYQYYSDHHKGELKEAEYDRLMPGVKILLKTFIDSLLRVEQLKNKLEDYGNFDDAICLEIDYLNQNGGIAAINGSSDFDLKQVQSSGYTFQVDVNGSGERTFNGIPFSPLARSMIITELRKQGMLSMRWNT